MVLPGHLAGGYLVTRGLLAIFHPGFSATEIDSLLIIGTLAGEFPDVDLIRLYFDNKPLDAKTTASKLTTDHRTYITHAPLLWLLISLSTVVIGYLCSSIFTEWIGWLILAGSWSHLLLDSIEYGVMWFWPFSKRRFVLKKEMPPENIDARPGSLAHHFQYITRVYMKTVTFWAEIIVTLAALLAFLTSIK